MVGKVGVDTDANWVAFCDKKKGNVLIATFEYDRKAIYPDGTSVQIWVQGEGLTYSRNRINKYNNDPSKNYPYMEIELLSPLCEMPSGGQMSFEYSVILCTIAKNTTVLRKNGIGVTASAMTITFHDNRIQVKGEYGVFKEGVLKLFFRNEDNVLFQDEPLAELRVYPVKCVSLDIDIFKLPVYDADKISIMLQFFDLNGTYLGDLDHGVVLNRYKNYQN